MLCYGSSSAITLALALTRALALARYLAAVLLRVEGLGEDRVMPLLKQSALTLTLTLTLRLRLRLTLTLTLTLTQLAHSA